jgi:predicted DNA-binding protein
MTDHHKHKAIIIRLPDDRGERLRAEAAARGVTVTWMANKLIEEALDHLRPVTESFLTRWDAES